MELKSKGEKSPMTHEEIVEIIWLIAQSDAVYETYLEAFEDISYIVEREYKPFLGKFQSAWNKRIDEE